MENKKLTVGDVYRCIEKMTERKAFNENEDLITFGLAESQVNKILVCWMADAAAIRYAAQTGADLMICHEAPFYNFDTDYTSGSPSVPAYFSRHTNYNRVKLLTQNEISIIRIHNPLDYYCIFDDFAAQLELGEPVAAVNPTLKVYEIAPVTYGDLIEHVKCVLGLPLLRASNGDLNRVVKRIGLPWGGLGLFVNVWYVQSVLNLGCDVLIAGETDNYGIRFAIDAGVDMIETGHEISENAGLSRFSRELAALLPETPVEFYENKSPFIFI